MKKHLLFLVFLCPLLIFAQQVSVIPKPVNLKTTGGNFLIEGNTRIKYNITSKELRSAADFFTTYIKNISGYSLKPITTSGKTIELEIKPITGLGDEGYQLTVTTSKINISANKIAGIIYGMQTIFQTLPAIRTNAALNVPCMEVTDYPRFKWRGMMLDVSRHFYSVDMVKEFLDLMSSYKMNVFHWHLVDDPGWRIEIKKYPQLTQ